VTSDVLCVGEYWVDMHWDGSELGASQNAARQKLCDWIDANGQRCAGEQVAVVPARAPLWQLLCLDGWP
jgi:hypothetical protein